MLPQKRFDRKLLKFEKFRIKLAFFINEFFTKFSLFFRQPQFNLIEVKIAANTPTMIMIATLIMLSLMTQFYVLEVQLKKLAFVLEIPEVL